MAEDAKMTHATLTEAMIAAQMEFEAVRKQATNPHFKAKYADLATVVDAVLPALNQHGILLTQPVVRDESGLVLRTSLKHTSGDELVSEVPLPDPAQWQQWGSALTYARRYAIMSLVGVAPEDDDGNDAAGVRPSAAAYKPRGEVTDPARKAQLAQQARAQQNAPPPAERPHEPADSRADPEATRAAGDKVGEARDRFMKRLERTNDLGALAELQQKLGQYEKGLGGHYQECAKALQAKQKAMMAGKDTHEVFTELEDDEWKNATGRIEDERQGDLV